MRPAPSARRALFSVSLLASAFLFAGCGALFGNRYNNFRAYYNAYYNAERVLEEGESQLDRQDQAIDRTKLLSLYPTASGGRGSGFQEAIDKSSELLRARGDSKWADDALFLIGKAYYYQRNLVGAEQKFRETIELATVRGNERLADESRIWLGRTLGASQRYEEGTAILQDRLAAAEGNRGDLARIRLVLGELYAREGRFAESATSLRDGLENERDSDFAARASMLLGQVLEADGKYAEAGDAYREVTRRQPPYELAYAANLSRALVLGLDADQTPEALDLIRRMRRDDKNYAHRAEVELAYGRLLAASGEPQRAVEAMKSVIYDPAMAGGTLRGETHARLAEYYRDVRGDFVRASAHFDTASTALRTSISPDETPTRAALLDVRRTAGAYKAYSDVAIRLAAADSLYELGSLDEEAFAARIEEIEARRLEIFQQEQRELAETRASQEFGNAPGQAFGQETAGGLAPGAAAGVAGRETGFLGFRDPASVQANVLNFQRVWGDRPLVPRWRRSAAIEAGLATRDAGGQTITSRLRQGLVAAGPPRLDLSPVPRTPAALTALRTRRAALRYEAANSLFFSLARPDSAAALYTLALEDGPAAEIAPQIQFALAEVEAARGQTERAEELYQALIDTAPDGALAAAARLRLGMAPPEVTVVVDSTSDAYETVRSLWREKLYPEAVGGFLALAADSARTEDSPRALLAASAAYIEWARADSFDVLTPLPDSLLPVGLFAISEAAPEAASVTAPDSSRPVPPEASGAAPEPPGRVAQPEPTVTLSAAAVVDKPTQTEPVSGDAVPGKPARTTPEPGSAVPGKPSRTAPPRGLAPPPPVQEIPAVDPQENTSTPAPPVDPEDELLVDIRPPRLVSDDDEELVVKTRPAQPRIGVALPADEEEPVARPRGLAPPLPPGMDLPMDSTVAPEAKAPDLALDVRSDSVQVSSAEPLAVLSDSSAAAVPPQPTGPTVLDVLALVQERAPNSPFAQRAAVLRTGLAPTPEASAGIGPDVAASGEPAPSDAFGFEGTEPLDPALGGFTWRAQRLPSAAAIRVLLTGYTRRGIRAAAIRDGEAYRLVVGQFATRPDAFGVREDLPTEVQGAGASIVPIDGLELLSPDDLTTSDVPDKGQ